MQNLSFFGRARALLQIYLPRRMHDETEVNFTLSVFVNGVTTTPISYILDFEKWPVNRGWPLDRSPLNWEYQSFPIH